MKPILIVSDSPDCPSGLARAGRDVALRLHQAGAKVGYCGYWGKGVSLTYDAKGFITGRGPDLPYPHLAAGPDPTQHLIPVTLAADEFFEGGPGVVLFFYDPTWLIPFGGGATVKDAGWENTAVLAWARRRRERGVELWGSFPVDAHCPSGKLPSITCEMLETWDRISAWTGYGALVLSRSAPHLVAAAKTADEWGMDRCPVLRLGMDPVWQGGNAVRGQQLLGVVGHPTLGAVGTNQPRKDWGLVFQTFSLLPKAWRLWVHIDRRHDYWNLNQLREEYGLAERVRFTKAMKDAELADCYAACAATLAPGRGEGFGYPILESQLAGTPCLHANYAGGAELARFPIHCEMLRPEGPYSFLRPVLRPELVASVIEEINTLGTRTFPDSRHLWENVWPRWETWFKEGGVL